MRKQITQAELRSVLDGETSVNRRMIQIRDRMRKGATIEPGELGAAYDGSDDCDPDCSNYHNMGLMIADAESTEPYRIIWKNVTPREKRSKVTMIRGGNLEVAHA